MILLDDEKAMVDVLRQEHQIHLFGYVEFPIAAFLLTTNLKLFYMLYWIIFPSS